MTGAILEGNLHDMIAPGRLGLSSPCFWKMAEPNQKGEQKMIVDFTEHTHKHIESIFRAIPSPFRDRLPYVSKFIVKDLTR